MADPADLEQLAASLEQSGDYRILRRVPVVTRYADDDPATVKRLALIVDIETTGLDPASDRIIELACLPFHFSSEGILYDVLPGYAGFEDPGQPLHEEVVRLTGITDDQLRGQKLDEQAVTTLATPANLIIAHNAAFDRCFLERRFPLFVDKPWACSMGQVPWAEEGLGSAKLDYLLNRFGFFFEDHRAIADCRAVLHLLSLRLPSSGRPILPLLLANARRRAFRLWALEAPIECKDLLKERGYRWNSGSDGRPRAWYRDLDKELLPEEERFLAEKVYDRGNCRHELIRIDYSNRFSGRVRSNHVNLAAGGDLFSLARQQHRNEVPHRLLTPYAPDRGSLMPNPWMSLWLSAANSWASAVRGFWTAELHRQQTAMANEMVRQIVNFWAGAWMAPIAGLKPKRRR